MTREWLAGINGATRYSFGERKVQFDPPYGGPGRRTKQAFKSENRTGYFNLDTYQTYSYDTSKYWLTRVQRESDAGQKADYQYDDTDGYVTKTTYGNGAYVTYGYDASGALTKISHYSAGATLIASNAYEFDAAGNVTKMVLDDGFGSNQTGDAVVTYQYDDLYRLTREYCNAYSTYRKTYIFEYSYDSAGNRVSKRYYDGSSWKTATCSYSARNELTYMSDLDGVSWDLYYDPRGNLTHKWDPENESRYEEEYVYTDYYWDSRDLLTKVHIFDGSYEYIDKTVEYKYDLMGRRVAKSPPKNKFMLRAAG